MQGIHLTADLHGCSAAALMSDADALRALCRGAVQAAGLQAVGELFHRFPAPDRVTGGVTGAVTNAVKDAVTTGVTGVVLLAESHLALHTWPERRAVTLDVFVCNLSSDNGARAQALLATLQAAFAPARAVHQSLQRGLAE